jgi:hypothetical protein
MNKAGRLVLVKVVLTAAPIYHIIALNLPKWFFKAIDKKRRGFLWKGHDRANGGNCQVAWEKVQRPLEYGGLGIHNLTSWIRPCGHIKQTRIDLGLVYMSLFLQWQRPSLMLLLMLSLEMGRKFCLEILFWKDRWLDGHTLVELAPCLFKIIPKRIVNRRTVAQALDNRNWVHDIKGALTAG